MTRKVPFENDEHYHVFNRGVERRDVFLDEDDYSYFVHILNIFNDDAPALNARYNYRNRISIIKKSPIVEIIAYSLLPNHFHLLAKQIVEKGLSRFLQKVGIGYTLYFNKKYQRSGVLFQGKSKSQHVDTDRYLNYLKMYIELNPLDLFQSGWKDDGIASREKAGKFLANYKWKSKPETDFLKEFSVTPEEFREYVNSIEIGSQ